MCLPRGSCPREKRRVWDTFCASWQPRQPSGPKCAVTLCRPRRWTQTHTRGFDGRWGLFVGHARGISLVLSSLNSAYAECLYREQIKSAKKGPCGVFKASVSHVPLGHLCYCPPWGPASVIFLGTIFPCPRPSFLCLSVPLCFSDPRCYCWMTVTNGARAHSLPGTVPHMFSVSPF